MLGDATKQRTVAKETTISDKLVETLSSNGVSSENNNNKKTNSHLHSKLGLRYLLQVARTVYL